MYENKYRNGQVSEYDKKRYEENKDYYREQYKKWCKNNPGYFEKYYKENKDRILESRKEYNKKYYEENNFFIIYKKIHLNKINPQQSV